MSCLVAFHYRSYGTFCIYSKRLHNFHGGFTHYRNYRAFNLANHGNHAGNYNTHVYTNYTDGSRSGVVMENTLISPKAPTLSLKDGGIRMTTDIYAPTNGTLY